LFHCLAGNERSEAGVVAFLMKYKGMTLDESIKYVLTQKPNVFFFGSNINFIKALKRFPCTHPVVLKFFFAILFL
jgi:protein-tyrosine phosphatase